MFRATALISFTFISVVFGQGVGTIKAETHPALTSQKCTKAGGCVAQSTSIVIDANWRWVHNSAGTNCYTGNTWDATLCSDPVKCATTCELDGADYPGVYGITTSGNALTLKFVTGANIGSRVYLMDTDSTYAKFKLKNQEFTFDVDVSNLPCGLNGAVYFTAMDADGGMSKFPNNKAGAKYGTGYCDAQCPHDIKFINGEANVLNWTASANDINSGTGMYGTCCTEMDIWEANKEASAYTPHVCTSTGQTRCSATECGDGDERYDGICDKDGCDFNSFRMGDQTFLGEGKTVDTTKVITVVTQFITDDGTATGSLSEIRRIYVQNGVVIQNSKTNIPGIDPVNSITDNFCAQQKVAFGDTNDFATKGGMQPMGDALDDGMVLALSVWDDHAANMLWLDSAYPLTKDATAPGVLRGSCATTSGVPKDVESQSPNASVIYSNIRVGDLDSTYSAGGSTTSTQTGTSTSGGAAPTSGTLPQYSQCGGNNWTPPTAGATCVSPYKCTYMNDYYSQCL